ncbi:uncharacterized protein L3040_001801 [Drepanopeziza brunnea f. sp. 'multigermtubi']|uniref:uncharacterized protein n=1 Tax=Drepanopeziza brunnea f. sp. 'multigermtubi' TaxID=698441 RepID=UPI002395CCC7|nr:hypothetical protein L3040_001801 [Drepanopeziza brunnea f. sp. 'multigermtubi']
MPPKKAASASSTAAGVYIVLNGTSIDSVHASVESANARLSEGKEDGLNSLRVEFQTLIGGSIIVDPVIAQAEKKPAKAKAVKKESKQEKVVAPKKTKTPVEQRAANSKKPKSSVHESELPSNYKALLGGVGRALEGLSIYVTGVPPTLGRKNAEKLVVNYGGKVASSLSKKTSYVVVGNDAGPVKLEKIESLGITTIDEDGLVKLIEGGGTKRASNDDGEEEGKPTRSKKRRT